MSNTQSVPALRVKPRGGIAGQWQFDAIVRREETNVVDVVSFVGPLNQYGPVVMIMPSGAQVFVTDPGRHGPFGREWVERFFA